MVADLVLAERMLAVAGSDVIVGGHTAVRDNDPANEIGFVPTGEFPGA